MDDHRHPEAYKECITSIADTFRSIPGIGLYMSRQLARSCCAYGSRRQTSTSRPSRAWTRIRAGTSPLKWAITENTRWMPPLKWAITENTRWAAAASVDHHREHPLHAAEPSLK